MTVAAEMMLYAERLVQRKKYKEALEVLTRICDSKASRWCVSKDCRSCSLNNATLELQKRVAS